MNPSPWFDSSASRLCTSGHMVACIRAKWLSCTRPAGALHGSRQNAALHPTSATMAMRCHLTTVSSVSVFPAYPKAHLYMSSLVTCVV